MIIRFRIKAPNGATTRWDYIEDADQIAEPALMTLMAKRAWALIFRDMEQGESIEFQKLEIVHAVSTTPR